MPFPAKPVARMSENPSFVPGRRVCGIVNGCVFLAVWVGTPACVAFRNTWKAGA